MVGQVAIERAAQTQRALVAGRRWIVCEPALDAALGRAAALLRLGAEAAFALGGSGTTRSELPHASLGVEAAGLLDFMHGGEAAIDRVPEHVACQIDAWDPGREALAMRAVFSDGAPVAGRRTYGARPRAWAALDDKTVIDAFWDRAGVPRAPSKVVPARADALDEAHRALDEGHGTVWAVDNREGWTGAGLGARWVHDEATRASATSFVTGRADRVRVMPFLEGVPCSIHGFVGPDHVMVLRPCELLTLRDRAGGRFVYGSFASVWDPPPADRQAMRAAARAVGTVLREQLDYRGAFTIDGVLTTRGFRPTELNPRYGAALSMLGAAVPEIDLFTLHLALVEREGHWDLAALEDAIVTRTDASRAARVRIWLPLDEVRDRDLPMTPDATGGWRAAAEGEPMPARVRTATTAAGPALFATFEVEARPAGAALGPVVASLANAVSDGWELGLPWLEAA